MLHLPVGIFDDMVIRESHQTGRQTLHIFASVHFAQAPRMEPLAHQIQFGLRHRAF
jgi:hypothetical protein